MLKPNCLIDQYTAHH